MHASVLEYECGNMRSIAAELHETKRLFDVECRDGDYRDRLEEALEDYWESLECGIEGNATMKTAAEKLREQLERLLETWMVEFDIDTFTVLGVLEDAKHGLVWGGTPTEQNPIDKIIEALEEYDDDEEEEEEEDE